MEERRDSLAGLTISINRDRNRWIAKAVFGWAESTRKERRACSSCVTRASDIDNSIKFPFAGAKKAKSSWNAYDSMGPKETYRRSVEL